VKSTTASKFVSGDLARDEEIEAAVESISTVVHCASSQKGDTDATLNLVPASSRVGVEHLLFVSVVGVDRVPYGYLRSKLAAERVVTDSGLPWTILRARQFYDLILTGAQKLAKLPVIPVPGAVGSN
jgi:uncharacterized protein YbjT (DUF2867 family)